MILKLICLVSASVFPFVFSLHGDFVFDDAEAILKNRDVSSDSWTAPFRNDFWGTNIKSNLSHKSYRPLTTLSFKLNYLLSGNNFSAFHFKITNLICHALCCIAVWKTFEKILKESGTKPEKCGTDIAFLASLLFAVHPVHVEAVSGIVGRADVLAALTFCLAFLCYTRAMESYFMYLYLLATVCLAAVSMLCKENGATVLGFCICYELITKYKYKNHVKTKTKKLSTYKDTHVYLDKESVLRIMFIGLSVILLLYERWDIMGGVKPVFQPIDNPAAFANNYFTKIASYNYIYFLNLLLLIWPQWLCYDWSMGCVPLVNTICDYRVLCAILVYLYGILATVSLLKKGNRKRSMLLAGSLMVIPFLPAANIFYSVGFVIAERVLYISSAGYCLLLTLGLNKICMGSRKRYKISLAFYSLLIITYGLRSWQRSFAWQREYQLFLSGLAVCPLHAKVHYNVAKMADENQQTEWAREEYKESIRLFPEYYQAMNNLANLLKNEKNYAEAEYYLRTALNLKHDFPAAWMNLGIVLANTGRFDEAHSAYKNALEYRRSYPNCLYNLGILHLEMNNTEDAKENWFKAISLKPTHALAWTNLLALLDNTGQLDEALQIIPKALKELPDSPSVNFAIANIYGKLSRYDEAEIHFRRAIELFGSKVQAIHYSNLGVLYHRWKKYELAKEMYKRALTIDPSLRSAHNNLNSLLKSSRMKL